MATSIFVNLIIVIILALLISRRGIELGKN